MAKPKSQQQFIKDCIKIHGNLYDYSKTIYKNKRTPIIIICNKHGEFTQSPDSHINNKSGCPKCGRKSLTQNEFIKKCHEVHEKFYDYSKVNYTHSHDKITIICPHHGEFTQLAYSHLSGRKCIKCVGHYNDTIQFIKDSSIIHNNKYDYSKTAYVKAKEKVIIICPEHGEFEQTPHDHKNGKKGCIKCSFSKGETIINKILSENNIVFHVEKKFDDCRNKLPLPFDFYLPDLNICIEYDGIQHFKPIDIFGGDDGFVQRCINDKIKNEYCEVHNIKLFRIKYDDNIYEKITEIINTK